MGLRSEASAATSKSSLFEHAIGTVDKELRTSHQELSASQIAEIIKRLRHDAVMDTASAIERAGKAWMPISGTSDADKTKLRTKRKEIWIWFIEVVIFRILSTFGTSLHGVQLPNKCDIDMMGPTTKGQIHAAECLASQFAASTVCNGNGCSGYGYYVRNVSTNTGSKSTTVPHATAAGTQIFIPRARYIDSASDVHAGCAEPASAAHTLMPPRYCPIPATAVTGEAVMPTNAGAVPAVGEAMVAVQNVMPPAIQAALVRTTQGAHALSTAEKPHVQESRTTLTSGQRPGNSSQRMPPTSSLPSSLPSASSVPLSLPSILVPPATQPQPPAATAVQTSRSGKLAVADLKASFFVRSSSNAEVLVQEAENSGLGALQDTFLQFVNAGSAAQDQQLMSALCIMALRWVYDCIDYKGVRYRPIGMGNSGASHASMKWLKDNAPETRQQIEATREFCQGVACLKSTPPEGRRCSDYFLKLSAKGEFQNASGFRNYIKVVRAAFTEVLTLHTLRTSCAEPPQGLGWTMHKTDEPSVRVEWSWSTLMTSIPEHDELPAFHASAKLWAALTTGKDGEGKYWHWYSFLSAQVLSKDECGQVLLRTQLEGNTSVCVISTDQRFKLQSTIAKSKSKTNSAVKTGKTADNKVQTCVPWPK
eukprot:jgi/Ulvmu1/8322/UM042_0028.1